MASATAPLPATRAWSADLSVAIRWVSFASLALFCAQAWSRLVTPRAHGTMLGVTAIALVLAYAVGLAGRRPTGRYRIGALAVTAVMGVAAILVACGAPLTLLRIDHWGSLLSDIGGGLGGLPDLRIPYRGADAWIRIVVEAGGGLMIAIAAVLALGIRSQHRRPALATLILCVVYAVPAVEVGPRAPYASGALFAALAAAAMWSDRLRSDQLLAAGALLGTCVLGGVAAGPALDAPRPWVDYEHLADRLAGKAATFDWNHRYGPLNWSRQGRVMFRVKAPSSGYWKGVALDKFDGLRWVGELDLDNNTDTQFASVRKDWFETVRVVAGDISSHQLYAPGDVIRIRDRSLRTLAVGAGTVLASPRPLRRGDSYTADVYSPRPTITEMRGAGVDYPSYARDHLAISLPEKLGGPSSIDPHTGLVSSRTSAQIVFAAWGTKNTTARLTSQGALYDDGSKFMSKSVYGKAWALAQRLRAQSSSPYDMVRRVYARVREGATYSENPPASRVPLEDFLFGHRTGYCQQFSGAMALLLRMGGVPARVASGFAPGVYDRGRREYVVRDLDAHSWVEVYFPKIGWVPFDPTPASSPASSQAASEKSASAATGDSHDRGTGVPPVAVARDAGRGLVRWWTVGLLLIVAASGAGGVRRLRRERMVGADAPPDLVELVRALHLSGRPPPPELTLAGLEQAFKGRTGAQSYLQTLRESRFAGRPGNPTAAQRTALRRDLGEGLGKRGRLRAIWALPPAPRQRLTQLLRAARGRFYPG